MNGTSPWRCSVYGEDKKRELKQARRRRRKNKTEGMRVVPLVRSNALHSYYAFSDNACASIGRPTESAEATAADIPLAAARTHHPLCCCCVSFSFVVFIVVVVIIEANALFKTVVGILVVVLTTAVFLLSLADPAMIPVLRWPLQTETTTTTSSSSSSSSVYLSGGGCIV